MSAGSSHVDWFRFSTKQLGVVPRQGVLVLIHLARSQGEERSQGESKVLVLLLRKRSELEVELRLAMVVHGHAKKCEGDKEQTGRFRKGLH